MATVVRSDQPVKVTGEGIQDRVLQAGEAYTFETTKLSVAEAPLDEIAPPPVTADVFAPTNRPNGAMSAVIAPKMPKSSGELEQRVVGPGVVIERAVSEIGQATQGGGPDSDPAQGFRTPGPQPEPIETAGNAQLGAATGDVAKNMSPAPRTREAVQKEAPEPQKKGR